MRDELSPLKKFVLKQWNSIERRVTGRKTYYDAQNYTSTDPVSGRRQADLLFNAGCRPDSHVLEIGCGCLSAGMVLMERLEPNHYVGIDPNEWLREAALRKAPIRALVEAKKPLFLSNYEFDAAETGRKFDFVLSHSILSHAAHHQLPLFLNNVGAVLSDSGQIFASLYLSEGNPHGNVGTKDRKDSMDAEWVYPGVSFFTHETIQNFAREAGLTATHRPDLTEWFVQVRPGELHDWFQFAKVNPA